ncbi:MAG: hypothetical protein A2498_06950 [Lentisphaerae bacterium RIFOXYC12_FULL_60_16]|nr:MAG: hypothetical protein A2498_06950 [Lentisphaerae bacterium RIFOXYC12_FULL_60_16]OGV68616.1 MAG: hypothetical protein A2269_03205 [Lentisphaerae bacterium RIFOXYA12_FULL_60_10]
MIVGLSAAALQGAPVVTQDIDLWFRDLCTPGIRRALRRVGGSYIPPTAMTPPMFEGDGVNLFDIVVHMHGLAAFEKEKANVLQVPLGRFKVPVLSLSRIIESKKATNREKDRLVMKVLTDSLRSQSALRKTPCKAARRPAPTGRGASPRRPRP